MGRRAGRDAPLTGEQTNIKPLATEIESNVQHVEPVLPAARFAVTTASVSPKGDPSSRQSYAVAATSAVCAVASTRKLKRARTRTECQLISIAETWFWLWDA